MTRSTAKSIRKAAALHDQGRFKEAERICDVVLAAAPQHADALHLSGLIKHHLGRSADGLRLVAAALKNNPKAPGALINHGVILDALKRHNEALESFDGALNLDAGNAVLHCNRGNALKALGRYGEALESYDRALALKPCDFIARNNRATSLAALERYDDALKDYDALLAAAPERAGADPVLINNRGMAIAMLARHEEALASFERALALKPDYADAHSNRGNVLKALGRYAEALESCDRALAIEPEHFVALYNRGTLLATQDRYDEALASYDLLFAVAPDRAAADPSLANNRGTALAKLNRNEEALASFDKALLLDPGYRDALNNRGAMLNLLGRYEESLKHYAQALPLMPDFSDAYINRGNALLALNRMDEALASFDTAVAIKPDNADAQFNAAITRLCLGNFRDGWKQYEWRWQRKNFGTLPQTGHPTWRGGDLSGKTVFIMPEQGMGDLIQFVRYVPMVAARGAKVMLGAHRPLVSLLTRIPGVSLVIPSGGQIPDFDLFCPLMNLPMVFQTEPETIPAAIPYIHADQERLAKWRPHVPNTGRLRVGLCWAGNKAHLNDRKRSMTLGRLLPLLTISGIDFFALQKDIGDADRETLRHHGVAELGPTFSDFADTAAVIAMLDLVISVDTSVAHLAGAMAKAVALLVPFSPDFRWMLDRTDTPWYPTMRLYRQSAIGDWEGPVNRLCAELEAVAARRRSA